MKIKFEKGFSLNGKWYKKGAIKEFDKATTKALIARGVVVKYVEKQTKSKG